ncbi:MAG: family 1 glycosylhydrolase [Ilumatobacteraceae bacterium]
MTFHRGVSLPTATTFGFADTADVGPTAGNGFYHGWPDDLAALQELGITDVRLTLDWPRLQQKPGDLDPDWTERFENILAAAAAIELRTWATLYDGSVPRWFDNEGGFADADTFSTWWPRWVERAADAFGDRVDGWVPFDVIPAGAAQPWRDTWGVIGGTQPVVASIDGDGIADLGTYVGRMNRVGLRLDTPWTPDESIADERFEQTADEWGTAVRAACDAVDDEPVLITGFRPGHDDLDVASRITTSISTVLDQALDDGVPVDAMFFEPGIAGHDASAALLSADRSPTVIADAFLG